MLEKCIAYYLKCFMKGKQSYMSLYYVEIPILLCVHLFSRMVS
jgi:hypothetical protein